MPRLHGGRSVMGGGVSCGHMAEAMLGFLVVAAAAVAAAEGATWCIARSGANATAVQTALDYACGAGADCTPIQPNGLCYLPNTLQSHASYAFNSYYQRSNMAPGSCDFAGTATVTISDPSFGSCTYPASPSTAGAVLPTTTNPPVGGTPTIPPNTLGGGLTPGFGPSASLTAAPRRTPLPPLLSLFFCCFVVLLLI